MRIGPISWRTCWMRCERSFTFAGSCMMTCALCRRSRISSAVCCSSADGTYSDATDDAVIGADRTPPQAQNCSCNASVAFALPVEEAKNEKAQNRFRCASSPRRVPVWSRHPQMATTPRAARRSDLSDLKPRVRSCGCTSIDIEFCMAGSLSGCRA